MYAIGVLVNVLHTILELIFYAFHVLSMCLFPWNSLCLSCAVHVCFSINAFCMMLLNLVFSSAYIVVYAIQREFQFIIITNLTGTLTRWGAPRKLIKEFLRVKECYKR